MKLRQTLAYPVNGYWDGGKKQIFEWTINHIFKDKKGEFAQIGSFEANFWFCVAVGKTDKLTLSYAKRYLKNHTKIDSTFEYIA